MRLSNRNRAPFYNFLITIINVLFFGGIGVFLLNKKMKILGIESYLLLIIPVILTFLFYIRGRQIFEYDSDGEALNFKNRNLIPFLDKPTSDEFPKYKLLKFEIVNLMIYKKLYVTISSKKSTTTTLKYDISYLSQKEVNDLKFSLHKVEKENKRKRQLNELNG